MVGIDILDSYQRNGGKDLSIDDDVPAQDRQNQKRRCLQEEMELIEGKEQNTERKQTGC